MTAPARRSGSRDPSPRSGRREASYDPAQMAPILERSRYLILLRRSSRLHPMLGNVLPGVRELRAPLAGGYLWLVFAWVVWGDKLPSKGAEKADALDRLYRLAPIV